MKDTVGDGAWVDRFGIRSGRRDLGGLGLLLPAEWMVKSLSFLSTGNGGKYSLEGIHTSHLE